jgi:glycosyltransferase involved in cell wall biosynthesis
MKILVIDLQWNHGFNGRYISMLELCRALPEGHDLKILGKYFKPDAPCGEALTSFDSLASTRQWITEAGWMPDVIWVNCIQELKLGDELSQTLDPGRKIPLVVKIHILKNALTNSELDRLIRLDQLICPSEYGTRMWKDTYGFDVAVIPNSVNLDRFKPDPATRSRVRSKLKLNGPKDRLLLYIGRLNECKGINDLFYIIREAQAARPDLNYHLAIVGRKGHMPRDFKQQIANFRPPNISIHNFSERPQEWMQAADVMLMPSRWEELFGKVIVESLACGLPVFSTPRGGIPEILKGRLNRFIMDCPCDPKQWGLNIAELEHESWAETLIAAAQEYAAPKLAQQYIELFEEVIART